MKVYCYVTRNDYTTFIKKFDCINYQEALDKAKRYSNFLCSLLNMKEIKDYEVIVKNR